MVAGAIQVPGDGQPILLLPDRQTTGGYAKIAAVIMADLDRAGQLKPRVRGSGLVQQTSKRLIAPIASMWAGWNICAYG